MNVPRKLTCRRSTVLHRAARVWVLAAFTSVTVSCGQPATPKDPQEPTPSAKPTTSVVPTPSANPTPSVKPTTNVKTTMPEQDVQAAMDDAIARLKSGDVVGFIEFYAPVDELRQARRGRLGRSYNRIQTPAAAADVVKRLERAKSFAPQINLGGFLATFTIPEPTEDSASPSNAEPAPEISQKALAGYPGSLAEVLKLAIADLEGNRSDAFIDRLFPRGELGHPDAALRRKQLSSRLKQHPEMARQMVNDLQAILRTQQVGKATGVEATIAIKGQLVPGGRGGQIQLPDRTFRFEKIDGFWRFQDTSSQLIKSQAKVAAQEPPSLADFGSADVVIMERFGDRWRFVEF
jgi:hypothetical protein